MAEDAPGGTEPVEVVVRGAVDQQAVDHARRRIGVVLSRVEEPVLAARVKLTLAADPANPRPALAQVSLDLNGDVVRAQVTARHPEEAVDLVERRLTDQLRHRAERFAGRRRLGAPPEPGEWRHGDRPLPGPATTGEARLVRRKAFDVGDATVDEAAWDMEQMDFDFYLFHELATGEDAMLERDAGGGCRLTRLHPHDAEVGPTAVPVTVVEAAPVRTTPEGARELLEGEGMDHVFFADEATGRGCVLYRRHDGDLGLLSAL